MWNVENLSYEKALNIANFDHVRVYFTLDKYPLKENETYRYEGANSVWSGLEKNILTVDQAKEICIPCHERTIKHCERWINHFQNRLLYEETMLDQQGGSDLLKPKERPKQLPLCNYKTDFVIVENRWNPGQFDKIRQIEMSSEEYKKIYEDHKGTYIVENSHRIRSAMTGGYPGRERVCVFLTDSKVHEKPESIEAKPAKMREVKPYIPEPVNEKAQEFKELKDQLKQGIKIVAAPQLFPTPLELCERMVELAEIEPYSKVLEPSAGTGNIVKAIINKRGVELTCVEINTELCKILKHDLSGNVINEDFLSLNGNLGTFDRIIMNPPFENGSDIKHIKHALTHLKENGVLVALCANGSRQQEQLKPLSDYWEPLPEGSFRESGTNVNVALLIIRK